MSQLFKFDACLSKMRWKKVCQTLPFSLKNAPAAPSRASLKRSLRGTGDSSVALLFAPARRACAQMPLLVLVLSKTMCDWDVSLRYILVGEERVGKTSLLHRFVRDRFDAAQELTIGVDFGARVVQVEGRRVKILAWDTAGQERYRSIARSYYRGAAVALIVYDVTRRSSLEKALAWLDDVADVNRDVCGVLVGNKTDAPEREVSREQGEHVAAERGLLHAEASAMNGVGVEEAFLAAARPLARLADEGERSGLVVAMPRKSRGGSLLGECCP